MTKLENIAMKAFTVLFALLTIIEIVGAFISHITCLYAAALCAFITVSTHLVRKSDLKKSK